MYFTHVCECSGGLVGPNCSIILMVLVGPFFIIAIVIACCCLKCYQNWKKRSEWKKLMYTTEWLVKWKDVTPLWRQQSQLTLATTPPSGPSTVSGKLLISAGSFPDNLLQNLVIWHNEKCYIQRLHIAADYNLSLTELKTEVIAASQLKHPHVVVLLGICIEQPNVGILTEFYPKGSLKDVLQSGKFPLDWDVKFSMLKDISQGMEYIHYNYGYHGRLKTSSCLMDNRWTIRISGFGVPTLRNASKPEGGKVNPMSLLWTAPELLRNAKDFSDISGSKPGDVYSFGIIMSDLCNEALPYTKEREVLSAEEIILLLKNIDDPSNRGLKTTWISFGGNSFEPFRPMVAASDLPFLPREHDGYNQLMRQCWHELATFRPYFKDIVYQIHTIKPVKGDLIDILIRRLEDYSTTLEERFLEASKELQMEKDRLEQLLSRMLPRKIVEDMIHGKKIEAEQFDMVTVCFSDIADFVSMTKNMNPFEVITLLNSLYTCFDAIIDKFDAYKVETVRDEYMVVSGLPVRNGYLHASQIAMLALHLLAAVVDFNAHLTTFQGMLMLRIGIHSGPCVAGVVGLQMPRYCLFGDTINVASRMKTSSLALQIHMSENTASILKIVGGFDLEYRGERDVKGRGRMKTYWLKGADNFNLPLPNPKFAVASELQQFK